jgi:hypothetical protein
VGDLRGRAKVKSKKAKLRNCFARITGSNGSTLRQAQCRQAQDRQTQGRQNSGDRRQNKKIKVA